MTRTLILAALLALGAAPLPAQDSVPTAHAIGSGGPRLYDALAATHGLRPVTAAPTRAVARATPRLALYDSLVVGQTSLGWGLSDFAGSLAFGLVLENPLAAGERWLVLGPESVVMVIAETTLPHATLFHVTCTMDQATYLEIDLNQLQGWQPLGFKRSVDFAIEVPPGHGNLARLRVPAGGRLDRCVARVDARWRIAGT
jgi:hypothetical protein